MADPTRDLMRMAARSYRDPLWRPDIVHYDDEGAALDADAHPHLMVLSRIVLVDATDPKAKPAVHNVLPGSIVVGGDGATMCGLSLYRLYAEFGPDRYRSADVGDGPTTCGPCGFLAAHRVRAHHREEM